VVQKKCATLQRLFLVAKLWHGPNIAQVISINKNCNNDRLVCNETISGTEVDDRFFKDRNFVSPLNLNSQEDSHSRKTFMEYGLTIMEHRKTMTDLCSHLAF